MTAFFIGFLNCLSAFFRSRYSLGLEILALHQQLGVLKRKNPRPRLRIHDRVFWILLRRLWPAWKNVLVIVTPETVAAWHRAGFRLFWRLRSRTKILGRPMIDAEIQTPIRRMMKDNRNYLAGSRPFFLTNALQPVMLSWMRVPGLSASERIKELENENAKLRREQEWLKREYDRLNQQREEDRARFEREVDRLRQERDRLKHELDLARRAAKRQAAPFSKGEPKSDPKRPGRKPGVKYGRKAHRAIPLTVDEEILVPSQGSRSPGPIPRGRGLGSWPDIRHRQA